VGGPFRWPAHPHVFVVAPGNRQHLLVGQARGVVMGDAGDVVAARFEESRDAKLGVLI
jgi:hypothetical protein